MEALKMIEKKENIIWNYDAEADVLYISFGTPKKAEGIDIGNGIIMRIDPKNNEIVGMTVLNPLKKTLKKIQSKV